MYIGEVADKTGLSIKAIRLYEEKGLIPVPSRVGRYRVYNESYVDILTLIKEAKALGFTLNQLNAMLVYEQGQVNWQKVQGYLMEHKNRLLEQQAILAAQLSQIDACIQGIDSCPELT